MLKKIIFLSIVILLLTISGIDLSSGNPYSQAIYKGTIDAPSQPIINISMPPNNSAYNRNSLSFSISVSIEKTNDLKYQEFLSRVYYTCDWLSGDTYIYKYYNANSNNIPDTISQFDHILNLTSIPIGEHYITFYAIEAGFYYPSLSEYYMLSSNASSTIAFTIDTQPPNVSLLLHNQTYDMSSISLNFTLDQPASKITYVLDGQGNVTISGNTTLSDLSYGTHNLTVYAFDTAGNVGASETVFFTITEPVYMLTFISALVLVVCVSVAVACLVVFFHRVKRKNSACVHQSPEMSI